MASAKKLLRKILSIFCNFAKKDSVTVGFIESVSDNVFVIDSNMSKALTKPSVTHNFSCVLHKYLVEFSFTKI